VCGTDVDGYTFTAIAYGDSKIVVVPESEIVPDTEWRFVLVPTTLVGKTADDAWINVSGTYDGSGETHTLAECVEPPVTTEGTEYSYEVEVEFIGKIDPRARIIRH
jgi:hypothetical protein